MERFEREGLGTMGDSGRNGKRRKKSAGKRRMETWRETRKKLAGTRERNDVNPGKIGGSLGKKVKNREKWI